MSTGNFYLLKFMLICESAMKLVKITNKSIECNHNMNNQICGGPPVFKGKKYRVRLAVQPEIIASPSACKKLVQFHYSILEIQQISESHDLQGQVQF